MNWRQIPHSSETLEQLITAQHLKGQRTYSVNTLSFLSLSDPPALWNANFSAGAGGSTAAAFPWCSLHTEGQVLAGPSLLAVDSTEQGGVQEMIPVTAGHEVRSESWSRYRSHAELQTALARGESLCILGFLQHAATLGRKRGVAVFSKPLNCLPCTLSLWMSFHENSDSYFRSCSLRIFLRLPPSRAVLMCV